MRVLGRAFEPESHRDDSVSHGKATVQNSVLVKRKRFFGVDSTKRRLAHLLTPRPRTKEGHRIRPCGVDSISLCTDSKGLGAVVHFIWQAARDARCLHEWYWQNKWFAA